jgi:crotonobetainyl-CoA:carnitine CoA-transferase CaiB-like acyl-CoA transferase
LVSGPLEGVTVIEIGHYVAGPYATFVLGQLGARVIKVERTDLSARPPVGSQEWFNFVSLNGNKESICINLKDKKGQEILYQLARRADVLVVNLTRDTIKKLGIGYDTISKINPSMIYCAIEGFGSGIFENIPLFGTGAEAFSGLLHLTMKHKGPPARIPIPVADLCAGLFGVVAVTCALREPRTKQASSWRMIEIPIVDSMVSWMGRWLAEFSLTHKEPSPMGVINRSFVPFGVYPTKDDRRLFIGIVSDHDWVVFCRVLGLERLLRDSRLATNEGRLEKRNLIDAEIAEATRKVTLRGISRKLGKVSIFPTPVYSVSDMAKNHYILHEGILERLQISGKRNALVPTIPVRMSAFHATLNRRLPHAGRDTENILRELGYGTPQILKLGQLRVVS